MNIIESFDRSLRGRATEPGLEWQQRTWTFGEIDARSNRVANALTARGYSKGDRLCVYLPNSLSLIEIFIACAKLGVMFVPINILYRDREIAHIVSDAGPREVVDQSALAALEREVSEASDERPHVTVGESDPAAIVYTSGTTGASKGAVLSNANFVANGQALVDAWRITSDDRFLLTLPLFHIHALGNGLHCWLMSGCRMRLLERFDHKTAIPEFLQFEPSLFFGVPTIYVRLLNTDGQAAARIGKRMRLFVSGSAPLSTYVFDGFYTLFGHHILERYGMTETFMTLSNPYKGERRAGSVGMPLPHVEAQLENGELLVRGPNVFGGYWKRPEATAAAFTESGFFRTGDLASLSRDGYYTLLGRRSDLIISGGYNIYPREIEELLLEQTGVAEAAVVGVEDELRGEVPVAFFVGDAEPARLEDTCRQQLASFKVPRRFIRLEAIPRTALGKVQKHLLPVGEFRPRRA
jgi:malonyl-CoA/methylmalonyl-CoA synthetase